MIDFFGLTLDLQIITGDVITHTENEHYHYLNFPDGTLYIDPGNRLEIGPNRPKWFNCSTRVEYPGSITINAARPVSTIAGDIARRLLPDARAYWQKCREAQDEHDTRAAKMAGTIEALKNWLTLLEWTYRPGERAKLINRGGNRIEADLYSDRINVLTINDPTTEQTIQILKILQGDPTP